MKALLKHCLRPLRPFLRRLAGAPRILLEEMPDRPALFEQYRRMIETGHKRVPGGWLVGGEYYPDYLTVGGCSKAIERVAQRYCVGRGIDIGAGHWPLPGAIPIDSFQGPGLENSLQQIEGGSLDYVFSSHCLEHIREWERALGVWRSKLRPGGRLFLYLPHPSCNLWHMSNPFMKSEHVWVPEPNTIVGAIESLGMHVLARDDGPDHFYSFYICAEASS